jgi:hypothetical protein
MSKSIIIANDICDLTPEWLRERGFDAVLCDLDNTLTGYGMYAPCDAVLDWIRSLEKADIPFAVVSNAGERRVSRFCVPLGLPYVAKARKPRADSLVGAAAGGRNTVMIGDQYFTDVRAARNAGMQAVLVPPYRRGFIFRLRRWIEKPFIRRHI